MIKNLLKNNQALTIYILLNIVIIFVPLIFLFINIIGKDSFDCYDSIGSFVTHTCGLSEYLFEILFWLGFGILSFVQVLLIPATVITYGLMEFLQQKYPKLKKKKLWIKYLFALFIYSITIGLIIRFL